MSIDEQELDEALRDFKDSQWHNIMLAKARNNDKLHWPINYRIRGRRDGVSPDDVISKLEAMGIRVSRSTLVNYSKWGLIPQPKRGSLGKGKGSFSDYPDETPAEAFATHQVLKLRRPKHEDLAEARHVALALMHNIRLIKHENVVEAKRILSHFIETGQYDENYDYRWLGDRIDYLLRPYQAALAQEWKQIRDEKA